MTIMGMFDYGLIVLFFIGVASLLFLVTRTDAQQAAQQQSLSAPQQAKGAYALLALLLVFLIAVTFFTQKGSTREH